MSNFIKIIAIMGMSAIVAGCGGSSDATTASASSTSSLKVSSKVSLIDAKSSSSSAKVSSLVFSASMAAAAADSFSATSDYMIDETFIYVQDDTSEALKNVNMILCSFAQIQPDKMLNKGNYKAQINDTQCNQNNGSSTSSTSSGGADQSGGDTAEYSYWVVNSARSSNTAAQVVQAWVAPDMDESLQERELIEGKMTITEGASASNSMGIFRMDFVSYSVDEQGNSTAIEKMKGFIYTELNAAGQIVLKYHNTISFPGSDPFEEGVTVIRNADGTEGLGSTTSLEFGAGLSFPTPIIYDFSYNADNFYRKDDSNNTACMDRTDFHETTWRYGMYDAAGKRVDITSGFPISTEGSGEEYHGWIGYWGLWMPSEALVSNGSIVTKETFKEGEVGETYTVAQIGGKLERHTKKTLTMAEIKNIPMNWWDHNSGTEYQVMWNGTSLIKNATRNQESDWRWASLDPVQTLTFSAGTYGFFFNSEGLGGDGQIKFDNWDAITSSSGTGANLVPTVSSDSTVIFHVTDIVYPDDATIPATLVCYDNCPDPTTLGTSNAFFDTNWNDPTPKAYTFDSGVLKSGGTDVIMATATEDNANGVWSGALFENSTSNLNALKCPWDSGAICAWQAWDVLDSYYTWSTGPNDWNKLTTLIKNGEYLKFQAPMQVKYTHLTGDYANTVSYLTYEGFGSLHGIPEMCINTTTGIEKDCWTLTDADWNSGDIRWMSKFVIPNGSVASSTGTTPSEYVIKSLETEQRMKKVDNSVCSSGGLSLARQTLPSLTEWIDPDLAAMPKIDGAPSVISGIVQ